MYNAVSNINKTLFFIYLFHIYCVTSAFTEKKTNYNLSVQVYIYTARA